jgi:hypothetical protein
MKKAVAFLLVAVLLMALSGCDNSSGKTNTNDPDKEPFLTWNGENNSPISDVYELIEKDIERVYFSGSQFREGRFQFERQEQYTWLISNLRKLKLLEKVDDYDIDNAKVYLNYEIQLRSADPITLHFYDNVVDFGQGYYFYTDANNSAVPNEITAISIGIPEFNMSVYYDNPEDIQGLRSVLTSSMSDGISAQGANDFTELINVYFSDSLNENISLYVNEENGTYFLFKNFFASYILMGEISRESYDTLILACKNQFGTREHFSVTSGETTIHPLGHFMYSTQYDKQTGQGLAADGFPQLSEWVEKLESVYYEPNFEFLVKDEHATLRISIAETHTDITLKDIEALSSGEYTITCILTTQGEYVEKANDYNSSTNVYWFKLIKQ